MNARLWMSPFSFLSISHLFWQPVAILVTLNLNILKELCFTDFQKSSFFYSSTWCSQYSENLCFFCLVENSLSTVIDSSMNKKNSRENTADIKFQTFVYVNNARQTWQSYQLFQRKMLALSVKNRPKKPNYEPRFIIRMTSNWGHY